MKMENNQEHKIDKIFKNSLENQTVIPPSDAWLAIHTYTIGQEESKKRIWFQCASLALLVLLFSGLGLWYYIENQASKELFVNIPTTMKKNKELSVKTQTTTELSAKTQAIERENINSSIKSRMIVVKMPSKNVGRVLNPDSVKTSNPIALKEKPLIVEIEEDSLINEKAEFVEPVCYFNKHNIKEIESKSLALSDLSDKIQKESERKVIALEENIIDKKQIFKVDSVVFGKRFSLKHPIINFRLGMFNSCVGINANQGDNNPFNSEAINSNSIYGFSGIIAIAWKLNKKSRISLNSKFVSYNAINAQSKSAAAYIDPLSPTNKPTGTFQYNASKDVYEYLTPFGYVTQPIDPKSSATPKDFDVWFSGSITNLQIGLNYEYDLIAFRNKKRGIPAMEIYALVGMNIQKIRKYRSNYALFENYDPQKNNLNYVRNYANLTVTNLENGSPIVFGYNTGLGIRLQLSKGFGLNISGNYEANINSWVKDLPFTTRLSVLSVESGLFINL
jgi:hypothetical protein